jgi:glycyl-tRNA synthetase beta chain
MPEASSDLLLELFSEEIPARMQAKAELELGEALINALRTAGLSWTGVETASGPRRLSVIVRALSPRSGDVREERKGPKVGAPEAAIAGFLRGAGLTDIAQAEIVSDPKKGDSYIAVINTPGRAAEAILAEAVPAIVRGFNWPKSMRTAHGDLRWVRPLQRITCVLGGKVVAFEVGGIHSANITEGHRVHGRGPYTVKGPADYIKQLEGKGHVRLSRADRRAVIVRGIAKVCDGAGLAWIRDEGLLEEVVGLAEWPVVILGKMDAGFLDLPPEVIRLSMRTHQKYFAVNDAATGKLAPHFIVVANIDAVDGGVKIAEGNARVLSARLSDARFFWEKDKATPLEVMATKLSAIAFKAELGSLGDKAARVAALAREIAPKVGADPDLAEIAARLAKADLVSELVGEFPELQGVMGRYYALAAATQPPLDASRHSPRKRGEISGSDENSAPAAPYPPPHSGGGVSAADGGGAFLAGRSASDTQKIADAIRDHYKPQGPADTVPTEPVAIAVALADKLDTLTGFWAIDEKPTGSKDPFALRRAALGVVRILLENEIRLGLRDPITGHVKRILEDRESPQTIRRRSSQSETGAVASRIDQPKDVDDLLSFFADRLKQYLKDQGQRHDLIDAVFALGEDDLVLIVKRVEALGQFLDTEDGKTLLAGYTRAVNILKAEDKKGALPKTLNVDAALIAKGPPEEQALAAALAQVSAAIEGPLNAEDFAAAMSELARLRGPVDRFFDAVMVNADAAAVRANRLALLKDIETVMHKVAVFSKIAG